MYYLNYQFIIDYCLSYLSLIVIFKTYQNKCKNLSEIKVNKKHIRLKTIRKIINNQLITVKRYFN